MGYVGKWLIASGRRAFRQADTDAAGRCIPVSQELHASSFEHALHGREVIYDRSGPLRLAVSNR